MEENGTLDLTKPTSEKEPGVYDVENDYVFGFRSATQMLNDLAEKVEEQEDRFDRLQCKLMSYGRLGNIDWSDEDPEVVSQEIMKSTMEEPDVPVLD